jgi:hypothetical protein
MRYPRRLRRMITRIAVVTKARDREVQSLVDKRIVTGFYRKLEQKQKL